MIQEGIVSLLSNSVAVTALVSTRTTPVVLPPNPQYPALTYTDISFVTDSLLQGPGPNAKRVRLDCWGKSYADAKALQQAVHSVFDGFTGTLSDGTVVQETALSNEIDFFESDSRVYRCLTEYIFYFV
jgi:hypothetical protein